MGELSEALTLLDVNAKSRAIVDRVAVMETRGVLLNYVRCALIDGLRTTARLFSRQGSEMEAEQAWRALIHCNPDNTSYYYGFFNSKNIDLGNIRPAFWRIYSSTDFDLSIGAVTDAGRSNALHLLQDLSKQNTRTTTPERLELTVVSGRSQPHATIFAYLMFKL
jgi:N-alpha-acetyltransferase 15/16, NatA auxiliary subunit